MFRLHLDVGMNKMMVVEFAKGIIHYLDETDGTVVIMGPLQPGEEYLGPMLLLEEDLLEEGDTDEMD